ncbi:MAG: hypothetical protein IJ875_01985 [Solobacterium sp.]|nr:hypothetical protein [Solobacterium sp.]
MKKIVLIGSVHMEMLTHIDTPFRANEDIQTGNQEEYLSGSGYQSALLLKQVNEEFIWPVVVGGGIYGEKVKKELKQLDIPYKEVDYPYGLTYRVIYENGTDAYLSTTEIEYDVDLDILEYLETEEIEAVILHGEMLKGDKALQIIAILQYLQVPVYYVAMAHKEDEMDWGLISSLKPIVFIEEKEALMQYEEKEDAVIDELIKKIYNDFGKKEVFYMSPKDEIYYYDGEEMQLMPMEEKGSIALFASAYAIARNYVIDQKNAMAFATKVASYTNEEIQEKGAIIKQNLVDIIKHV